LYETFSLFLDATKEDKSFYSNEALESFPGGMGLSLFISVFTL